MWVRLVVIGRCLAGPAPVRCCVRAGWFAGRRGRRPGPRWRCVSRRSLHGVLRSFSLPETNARYPGRCALGRRAWVSMPVDPKFEAFGGGVGEHVGQSALSQSQSQARPVRGSEAAPGSQGSDPADRLADSRAADAPYSSAGAACASFVRRWTRARTTRTVKTSCCRRARTTARPTPRSRCRDAEMPRCRRETPAKAGWDEAARSHFLVTVEGTRVDVTRSAARGVCLRAGCQGSGGRSRSCRRGCRRGRSRHGRCRT